MKSKVVLNALALLFAAGAMGSGLYVLFPADQRYAARKKRL